MRTFETGATRDDDKEKLDYEGFFHPLVMKAFAEYMHTHRIQSDGSLRDADNWQKGMSKAVYMKSMFRHFMDVWTNHRLGESGPNDQMESLMALMFNVQGYAYELLRDSGELPK